MERARSKVDSLTRELVVGDIFTGNITRITNFGAFVELVPGRDGLVRSGEMGDLDEDELSVGKELTVMINEIDSQGRINLSRRALFGGEDGQPAAPRPDSRPPAFDRGRGRPGGGFGGRGGGGGGRGRAGGGGPRQGGPDRRFMGGSGPRQG